MKIVELLCEYHGILYNLLSESEMTYSEASLEACKMVVVSRLEAGFDADEYSKLSEFTNICERMTKQCLSSIGEPPMIVEMYPKYALGSHIVIPNPEDIL